MTAPHSRLLLRDMTVYALLGTLLFLADIAFDAVPNVHPLAMLIVSYTFVYRCRALIPIYIYVVLTGFSWGFQLSWLAYLYIWLPLWGLAMLIPRHRFPVAVRAVCATVVCVLHGLAFGILWAPFQMLCFGLPLSGIVAWVIAGFPMDVVHGLGNGVASLLIIPLSSLLYRLEHKRIGR